VAAVILVPVVVVNRDGTGLTGLGCQDSRSCGHYAGTEQAAMISGQVSGPVLATRAWR